MITNLLKYLYFLLFSVFLFLFISLFSSRYIIIEPNIIFLYSLIIIPFADILINKIKIDLKNLIFYIFSYLTLLFWLLIFYSWYSDLIEILILLSYVFLITWVVNQYATMLSDLYFQNMSDDNKQKDIFTWNYLRKIYVIVTELLLIWLFIEVISFIFIENIYFKVSGILLIFLIILLNSYRISIKKDTLHPLKKYSLVTNKSNESLFLKNIIFPSIFLFLFILFLIWFVFNVQLILIISFSLLFISYIFFRFCWNSITSIVIDKYSFNLGIFFIVCIISSIIFLFSWYHFLEVYDLIYYRESYIIYSSILFFILFFYIFWDYKFIIKSIKNLNYNVYVYIFISLFFVIILSKGYDINISNYSTWEVTSIVESNNTNNISLSGSNSSSNLDNSDIENDWTGEIEINTTSNMVKIWELYQFENYLSLYNESDDTLKLQEFLTKLWYYSGEINGTFDINTRNALRETLMNECNWPNSTKWVLGVNAADCIEGLEVER